jgi:hypothetical protein
VKSLVFLISFISSPLAFSQSGDSLELLDSEDAKVLLDEIYEDERKKTPEDIERIDLSELEEIDDLESLRSDVGDYTIDGVDVSNDKKKKQAKLPEIDQNQVEILVNKDEASKKEVKVVNDEEFVDRENSVADREKRSKTKIFDVGSEEKQLLDLSKFVESKIPDKEWNEISTGSQLQKYVVQQGDWLWKISKTLFGSGFYYSKIWSMNPHITNPHEIEPGMILVFDSGDSEKLPEVKLSEFVTDEPSGSFVRRKSKGLSGKNFNYKSFGIKEPAWIKEREKLIAQGVYFQFASEETYEDLADIEKISLRDDYEKYAPPVYDIAIKEPTEEYYKITFDKDSRVKVTNKDGFYLNTFVTTNVVQDLGEIDSAEQEGVFIRKFDTVYVKFDHSVKVKPGDQFSIYSAAGKVTHHVSDRIGYKYSVVGQVKTLRKVNDLWACEVSDLLGIVQRRDRITVYTPKLGRIVKTYSPRSIEAAVIGSYREAEDGISTGDVVYLDRGRADGVEMGNVFELYSFHDRGTGKRITPDPTYKIGEVSVITLTDNFATALVMDSRDAIRLGTIAISKNQAAALTEEQVNNKDALKRVKGLEDKALEELDVELNIDDLSKDLLKQADKIQLTEDELEELERQEREKSIIKDHEKDLKALERLEKEIIDAERELNEAKVDEDKFLEQQNLDEVERNAKKQDPNAFESLNEIEQDIGRKYMDQDLNSKENPYGLTEFDLEEVDELLNTGKQ